jgi:hypothetical protein
VRIYGAIQKEIRSEITRPGLLLARALAGSWRAEVEPAALTDDQLASIVQRLIESGGGALYWRCIRDTPAAETVAGARLRDAARVAMLQTTVCEKALAQALRLLAAAGIEPLVAKGWAVARRYPARGLRPYADLDLIVGAEHFAAARAALASGGGYLARHFESLMAGGIDLHEYVAELDDRDMRDLRARAQVVALDDLPVRVLSLEDQFRMSCLHLLRHQGRHPLWWCDIGAMIESTPDMDWDLVLHGSARRAAWIGCVARAAHALLGARITSLPRTLRDGPVPRWLAPAVYRRWEEGMTARPSRPAASYLRDPRGWRHGIYERWPTALAATLRCGGLPDDTPRWPYQLRSVGMGFARVVRGTIPLRRAEVSRNVDPFTDLRRLPF